MGISYLGEISAAHGRHRYAARFSKTPRRRACWRPNPDVVVVGAGIAGTSAALHASQSGAQVWLIEKEDAAGRPNPL